MSAIATDVSFVVPMTFESLDTNSTCLVVVSELDSLVWVGNKVGMSVKVSLNEIF